MKSIAKPSFYFSAYPLRVIKEPSQTENQLKSPYLKALLSGKSKTSNRARVLPMKKYNGQFTPSPSEAGKLSKDIELTEKDWFNNYE